MKKLKQNYKTITDLRKHLFKVMLPFRKDGKIEYEILSSMDDNKVKYAYVHLKDYSDGEQWGKALAYVYLFLSRYSYANIDCGSRKQLFWIPKDRSALFIQESGIKNKIQNL